MKPSLQPWNLPTKHSHSSAESAALITPSLNNRLPNQRGSRIRLVLQHPTCSNHVGHPLRNRIKPCVSKETEADNQNTETSITEETEADNQGTGMRIDEVGPSAAIEQVITGTPGVASTTLDDTILHAAPHIPTPAIVGTQALDSEHPLWKRRSLLHDPIQIPALTPVKVP